MAATIVRFVLTLGLGLAAFWLTAHGMHLAGHVGNHTIAGVDAFYAAILRPVTSLDPAVHRTTCAVAAVATACVALVHGLFRRWAYRPDERIDPLVAAARPADFGDRPAHTASAAENAVVAPRAVGPAAAAAAAVGLPQDEYERLLGLLRRRA